MRINTNTDTLELTAVESRTLEKSRTILQQLGKHGSESIQEQAAKAVVAINMIQMELANQDAVLEV